jgi:hypothetical protein
MSSGAAVYLDTSVALRATLEQGTTPEIENRIASAPVLMTSRLSLVESARALLRVRLREERPKAGSPMSDASSIPFGAVANSGS